MDCYCNIRLLVNQNHTMKSEIEDYAKAVENHINNLKAEIRIKDAVRKSYHAAMMAKEAMRGKEREIMEDSLELNHEKNTT